MGVLEVIGAITVIAFGICAGAVIYELVREARRSLKQWCRVCRIICGRHWKAKAFKDWRTFFKGWWLEFGEGYDSKEIRGIVLPYDPSKAITRRTGWQ